MTLDPNTAAQGGPSRGIRVALAVSVAINLAVAGVVAGVALHGGGPHGDLGVRDLGFGPYDQALLPEDREALRQNLRGRLGDFKAARDMMRADGATILSALRQTPFDAATLTNALKTQREHLQSRLALGSDVMAEFLVSMPEEARLRFADRLEERMRRGPEGEDKGDKP